MEDAGEDRPARPRAAQLRAAGRGLGAALARLFTGRRRGDPNTTGGRRRRSRPVASMTSAFLPGDDAEDVPDRPMYHSPRREAPPGGCFTTTSGSLMADGFPLQLSHNGRPQGLLTIGHKQWGNWWDGRGLLNVRIYDFAVYADSEQVQHAVATARPVAAPSPVRALAPGWASLQKRLPRLGRRRLISDDEPAGDGAFFQHVNQSRQVAMSLQLRAARDIPVWMLAREFDTVLQRRSEKVGGSREDPALTELVGYFTPRRLPSAALAGGAVRRGSVITFTRTPDGRLVTLAGGVALGEVQSPKLCEALFDLYMGDPPVSRQAKAAGDDTLSRMSRDSGQLYRPAGRERVSCSGGAGDISSCVVLLEE